MSLVAAFAVGSSHIGAVRFVALGTERNLAMNIMAEAAGKLGVFAWNLLQLDNLLTVAGETLIGYVVGQLDDLGSVWIVVTTKTAGQLEMRLIGMTHTTLGNIVLNRWTVAGMAILAGHVGFVLAAICGNIRRRIRVTLHTIATAQHRFRRIRGNGTKCRHTHQRYSHTNGFHKFRQAFHYIPSYLVEYKPIHRTGLQMQKI